MKDMAQAASIVQIIRCDYGDLAFGIDKADVLSIQRTERLVFRGGPEFPDGYELPAKLENPEQVIGWLTDGIRRIPVIQLSRVQAGGARLPEEGRPPLGDAARVIIFAPTSPNSGPSSQASSPPWGLLVDRVVGMIEAPQSSFHSAPWILQDPINSTFRSVVRIDNQVLMLLEACSVSPYRESEATADSPPHQWMVEKEHISKAPLVQAAGLLNRPSMGKPGSRGLVVFSLWDEFPENRRISLGLSISQVPEIFETSVVIAIPAGPEFVQGLVFWREIPIPIIDIASRMGFHPANSTIPSLSRRFIIARQTYHPDGSSQINGGQPRDRESSMDARPLYAAFEVRSDVRILRLPIESQPSSRSLPIKPGMVLGQVELENETLVIPNLKAVLSQDVQ